jgi:hypothetical protein
MRSLQLHNTGKSQLPALLVSRTRKVIVQKISYRVIFRPDPPPAFFKGYADQHGACFALRRISRTYFRPDLTYTIANSYAPSKAGV